MRKRRLIIKICVTISDQPIIRGFSNYIVARLIRLRRITQLKFQHFGGISEILNFVARELAGHESSSLAQKIRKDSLGLPPIVLSTPVAGRVQLASSPFSSQVQDSLIELSSLFAALFTSILEEDTLQFIMKAAYQKLQTCMIGVDFEVTKRMQQYPYEKFSCCWSVSLRSKLYSLFDLLPEYVAFRCLFASNRVDNTQMFAGICVCVTAVMQKTYQSLVDLQLLSRQDFGDAAQLYELLLEQDFQWIQSLQSRNSSQLARRFLISIVDNCQGYLFRICIRDQEI